MPRTFRTEFPEFTAAEIPAEFLDASQWLDASWHNELCPRFVTTATTPAGFRVCVWVDRMDAQDREEPELPRFCVSLVTAENDLEEADCPGRSSFDCDNVAQVWQIVALFSSTPAIEVR